MAHVCKDRPGHALALLLATGIKDLTPDEADQLAEDICILRQGAWGGAGVVVVMRAPLDGLRARITSMTYQTMMSYGFKFMMLWSWSLAHGEQWHDFIRPEGW